MKKLLAVLCILCLNTGQAQEGVQFGLNVTPSYKLNITRQKGTGLGSNQGGYGFTIGVPVKIWRNDYFNINTGINYEFATFDGFENGFLVSSVRFNSLNIPLLFHYNLSGNLYAVYGTGLVYNLSVRDLNAVGGADITGNTNNVQPYLGLGITSFMEKGSGALEVGAMVRYQFIDIWNKDYAPQENFNSHLASLDVLFRYYF